MENDRVLLGAVKRMDKQAITAVFDEYAPALYRYALRRCNDPLVADQLVGDVFARFLEQLSRGKGPHTNLRSYLFEIAYHLLVDRVRYLERRLALEALDPDPPAAPNPEVQGENRILTETLIQVIQNDLSESQRHVIILRFLEGFSLQETAAILGKSVDIIKVAQSRAVGNLRKYLYQWEMT